MNFVVKEEYLVSIRQHDAENYNCRSEKFLASRHSVHLLQKAIDAQDNRTLAALASLQIISLCRVCPYTTPSRYPIANLVDQLLIPLMS
jgi:hypothetical protein